jgi:hypothetical protein
MHLQQTYPLMRWLRHLLPQRCGTAARPETDDVLEPTYGAPLPICQEEVIRLTCLEGVAWLTIAGEPQDVILTPGQMHLVLPRERGLLTGMPAARVRVTSVWGRSDARRG